MQNNRFSRVDFMNLDFDMCIVLTFLPCFIFVSMRVCIGRSILISVVSAVATIASRLLQCIQTAQIYQNYEITTTHCKQTEWKAQRKKKNKH